MGRKTGQASWCPRAPCLRTDGVVCGNNGSTQANTAGTCPPDRPSPRCLRTRGGRNSLSGGGTGVQMLRVWKCNPPVILEI